MEDRNKEIYSKRMLASKRRTYFFDVRETRAGDYYLTITESKKTYVDDNPTYKKNKIFIYKENFEEFAEHFKEFMEYIHEKKGKEVISDYQPREEDSEKPKATSTGATQSEKTKKTDSNDDELKIQDVDFDSLDK